MDQLEFYMDVSPEWWIKSRKDESHIKKYICEKFEYDFYPRNISNDVKSMLLDKLKGGKFVYEFLKTLRKKINDPLGAKKTK